MTNSMDGVELSNEPQGLGNAQETENSLGAGSKFQRLGIQCISPGLCSENMDNKMLTTIRISKTIAREQRQHIEKLGGASNPIATADSGSTSSGNGVSSPGSETSLAGSQSSLQDTLAKPRGKSLKRSKVPSPLNIGTANNVARGQHVNFHPTGVESAPANMTNYRQANHHQRNRVLKPRVQYIGKNSSRQQYSRRGFPVPMGYPSVLPVYSCGPQYQSSLGHSQSLLHPCMPMLHPLTAYPRLNVPQPQQQQMSSQTIPSQQGLSYKTRTGSDNTSKIQVDFENFMEGNKQNLVATRDFFANNTSKWAPLKAQPLSAQENFFFGRHSHNKSSSDRSDNDDAADRSKDNFIDQSTASSATATGSDSCAPENSNTSECQAMSNSMPIPPRVTSASLNPLPGFASNLPTCERIRGEITILEDTFAFEFSTTKDKIDKRMFMSICDKVWDESKKLNSS
ncbi:Dig1p Ecym_2549 [Eremothecium cymbalariae DBVPG|uniref:Uncharacterized protein n=1 Tax=Eremothecium cymbalariae (strain CBS 270.75 / DBVPG 7215 / KCTC 17166 / NRRL Y-17582) TaxID=931890 RepID=G8JQB1_ERECY|nr:Hypothetical protein Ecym_2549 [Eremothecium cymbalariae DBVPG\